MAGSQVVRLIGREAGHVRRCLRDLVAGGVLVHRDGSGGKRGGRSGNAYAVDVHAIARWEVDWLVDPAEAVADFYVLCCAHNAEESALLRASIARAQPDVVRAVISRAQGSVVRAPLTRAQRAAPVGSARVNGARTDPALSARYDRAHNADDRLVGALLARLEAPESNRTTANNPEADEVGADGWATLPGRYRHRVTRALYEHSDHVNGAKYLAASQQAIVGNLVVDHGLDRVLALIADSPIGSGIPQTIQWVSDRLAHADVMDDPAPGDDLWQSSGYDELVHARAELVAAERRVEVCSLTEPPTDPDHGLLEDLATWQDEVKRLGATPR